MHCKQINLAEINTNLNIFAIGGMDFPRFVKNKTLKFEPLFDNCCFQLTTLGLGKLWGKFTAHFFEIGKWFKVDLGGYIMMYGRTDRWTKAITISSLFSNSCG